MSASQLRGWCASCDSQCSEAGIAYQILAIIEEQFTNDQAESRSKSSDSEGRNTETIEP
jgi:hypothetical protein